MGILLCLFDIAVYIMDKANHRGRAYRCRHCQKKGKTEINTKQRLEDHIFKYHVPNDEQPYWCRLCLFRSRSKEGLMQHVNTFARHRNVMIEKGIEHSRPFLVCSLNPYIITDKDLEQLSREESRTWWERRELPRPECNILQKAMEVADISFGLESPKLPFMLSEGDETEMAVECIRERKNVMDVVDKWENDSDKMNFGDEILDLSIHKEREEITEGAEEKYVDESPLDLRIVRRREDRAEEERKVNDHNEEIEDYKKGKRAAEEEKEKKESIRRAIKESRKEELDIVETQGREEESSKSQEVGNFDRKLEGRRSRTKTRIRHSLKRTRTPSSSSSSSSSRSSSSASTSSADTSKTEDRERKFCKIMCNLVKETGNIIGSQIISNAEMINKLQRTVDELRKEVADLKRDRVRVERTETVKDSKEENGGGRHENGRVRVQKESILDTRNNHMEGGERCYRGERALEYRAIDRRDRRGDNYKVESWRRGDWNRGYRY